jgi:hypothetical protein
MNNIKLAIDRLVQLYLVFGAPVIGFFGQELTTIKKKIPHILSPFTSQEVDSSRPQLLHSASSPMQRTRPFIKFDVEIAQLQPQE